MTTKASIRQTLIQELASIFGQPISAREELASQLEFDSFTLLQIVAFIEDHYCVEISEELLVMESFSTIDTIVDWLCQLKAIDD